MCMHDEFVIWFWFWWTRCVVNSQFVICVDVMTLLMKSTHTHTHRIVTLIAERFLIHSSNFILISLAAAFIVLYAMRNIHISHQRSIVAFIYVSQSLTIALKRLLTLAKSIGSMQQSKWKIRKSDHDHELTAARELNSQNDLLKIISLIARNSF